MSGLHSRVFILQTAAVNGALVRRIIEVVENVLGTSLTVRVNKRREQAGWKVHFIAVVGLTSGMGCNERARFAILPSQPMRVRWRMIDDGGVHERTHCRSLRRRARQAVITAGPTTYQDATNVADTELLCQEGDPLLPEVGEVRYVYKPEASAASFPKGQRSEQCGRAS